MARISLPPGFRFYPTDVELIMYYLKRKVMGKNLVFDAVTELNVYKFAPWDLPDKCLMKSKDLEWYFFCPREEKHTSGARSNRATENGYWKITGTNRLVTLNQRTVGTRKTLIFYKGHPPKGERTDWVMHEYRLGDKNLVDVVQDAYVLCKIFQKSGLGPKNGEQYGAIFNDEEWSDMDEMFVESQPVAFQNFSKNVPPSNPDAVGLSVPRDLLVNFVPEPDPFKCLPPNTDMQPTMKEICVESSSADPHTIPKCVPPGTIGSSAAICMTAPVWSTSKSGPSTAGPPVMDMPDNLSYPDDVLALLNMFVEDNNVPTAENNTDGVFNTNEKFEMNGHLSLLDENGIYNDLGDLNDWIELRDTGFDISRTEEAAYDPNPVLMGEDAPFLELNDLSTPLRCPSEAGELDWMQTGSISAAHHTYDMSIGMDESYSGGANLCPVEVFGWNEYSALLEGPHLLGNNHKKLEKDNCIGNFEAQGFDAVRGSEVPFATTEPEGSSTAEENQRRRAANKYPTFVGVRPFSYN